MITMTVCKSGRQRPHCAALDRALARSALRWHFPAWRILISDAGRWWAFTDQAIIIDGLGRVWAGQHDAADADDPRALAAKLNGRAAADAARAARAAELAERMPAWTS